MKIPRPKQIYEGWRRHNWYEIICLAEDADTLETLVIYKQIPKNDEEIDDDKIYAKSLKSFMEEVEVDGKMVPRYKEIKRG